MGQAALVALLAASGLGAQGLRDDSDRYEDRGSRYDSRDGERLLFTWRGRGDDVARIYVRGANVRAANVRAANARTEGTDNNRGRRSVNSIGRANVERALPRCDGVVHAELLDGRGRVEVVQQPSEYNDYTAILQVRDWRGGRDTYRIAAYFDPADSYRDRGDVWGTDRGGGVYSGSTALRWSGNVDGDLRISISRGQLAYQTVSGMQPQNVRVSVGSGRQQSDGQLMVQQRQGRGTVQIFQQPSAYNNYTAVVRVLDTQGGFGYYDFDLVWR